MSISVISATVKNTGRIGLG